ncbi:MAG: HEAT repeat domain-containing protein [Verrucomicrobiae bacterium]|nr:HEAT repeat domain-containing protein [Verrucomicrobiae bacterium]
MKNRSKSAIAISIVLVLGAILWLTLRTADREPSYQGKPLGVWLKGFDAAQGSAEYAAAQSAVQHFGTNVVPRLIYYLRRKDPPFYTQWINLKAKLHLLHGEVDYAVFWNRRAAHACGALGPAGEAAFPALTKAMNDRGAASDVGNGLSRMMPTSVPVLTNVLATGSVVARCRAADNLVTAFSHPGVEGMARTALIVALHDSDRGVRMTAASAFQFWNTNLDSVVPELARRLSDPDASVRGNAATSLGNFGSAAKAAVPELLKLLQDTNSYVSGTVADRAAMVLSKIDPEAAIRPGVD